ncbi:MAG: class I SAM-dependent methyltransferase [Bacteroidota bacterium]
MHQLKALRRFLRYFFRADTYYQVHSPFVYEFATEVLEDEREYYIFRDAENLRFLLSKNHTEIQTTDFGAGSVANNGKIKSISDIVKNSASRPWQCQTLFRLVNHYKPKTMLELGTSLGISTLYQSQAALNARFITLEGDPQLAELASYHFEELKITNVKLIEGRFEKTLDPALRELQKVDYIFMDGNHRITPTLEYFELCLNYAHNDTIFVVDDIHWSEGMELAWNQLKAHPKVTLTIDLFHMGIIFIRKEQKTEEHFILAPLAWKPWASSKVF